MRHKHRKHFSVTLLVSLAMHLFILTVLFTLPSMDEPADYKKVRVKLGLKDKPSDNISRAQKYAEYNPGAGSVNTSASNGNSIRNIPPIPAKAPESQKKEEPNTEEKKDTSADVANHNIDSQIEAKGQAPELQRVIEQAAKNVTQEPPTPPVIQQETPEEANDEGTIIGNSSDKDADKLASYEQMLPLWLDKFKIYPEEAKSLNLAGTGEVFIKIDRKGKVLLSKIIKSTGYPALDKALMKMIADADPVIPVPLEYHSDKKTFSYKIAFEFTEPKQ